MLKSHPLIVELEATLAQGPGSQRFTILRKVTDLFLANADSYTDDHLAIFDELMIRLIETIERQALIELSGKLAPIERAPVNVIGRLSHDDDIAIAGPVLEQSKVLTDRDLVAIAETKSQAHLSAIAGRRQINEPVTDVLINRGGLAHAVKRATEDESLALAVANRADLPPDLLDQLVQKATATVRQRLFANARPEMRDRIAQVLATVSGQAARLRARITQSAETRNADDLIDALAQLSEVPVKTIKDFVRQESDEGMLVLGRACGMGWPELQDVLSLTMPEKISTPEATKAVCAKYVNLSSADARRAIRFIRTSASKSPEELRNLI
jgi:uncharacterized protein (DUF2336 family)